MGYGEQTDAFDEAVEAAARRLVSVRGADDGYVIGTSSLYPSGASVQVRAAFDGHTCYVSDMGLASHEAEMLGATTRQFRRHARSVADELGVAFDDHSFFIVQVPIARLSGALKVVAAASHRAAVITEMSMTEQAERNDRELLLDKLVQVFGAANVEKAVMVSGKSGHAWPMAGRVRSRGGVIFDTATPQHVSVASAYTKFQDIRMVEGSPKGVIALAYPSKFSPDLRSVLEQSAEIISISDPEDRYLRLLEAA